MFSLSASSRLLKTKAFSKGSTLPLINNPCMGFARYLNRSEQSAQDYKTNAGSMYYQPQQIYTIHPSANYPDEPLGPKTLYEWQRRRTVRLVQEKIRDLTHFRGKALYRSQTGRKLAHLRHIELKDAVQNIRNLETGVGSSKRQKVIKASKGITAELPELEETYKLPFGLGFDDYIKAKTDKLNEAKTVNY